MGILLFFIIIGLLTGGYFVSIKILSEMTAYLTTIFNVAVISLAPHDIILTIFKIDMLLVGLFLFPFLLMGTLIYVTPALYEKEKKILGYIPAIILLALLGMAFGWLVAIKIFIPYLQSFSAMVNIPNNWAIVTLVSFILTTCLVFVGVFQLPIILIILENFKVLKIEQIKKIRKVALLIALIFGAVVTPPDVGSQLIVAVPFWLLFELTIQYIKFKKKISKKYFSKKKNRKRKR